MGNRLGKIVNFCIISMFFVAACASPEQTSETTEQGNENIQIEETEQAQLNQEAETTEQAQISQEVEVMEKLNKIAIHQMKLLTENRLIKKLGESDL